MAKRGRPREHDEDRVVTAMRFPKSLLRDLKITALVNETSVNDILVRAATDYLAREGATVVPRQVSDDFISEGSG